MRNRWRIPAAVLAAVAAVASFAMIPLASPAKADIPPNLPYDMNAILNHAIPIAEDGSSSNFGLGNVTWGRDYVGPNGFELRLNSAGSVNLTETVLGISYAVANQITRGAITPIGGLALSAATPGLLGKALIVEGAVVKSPWTSDLVTAAVQQFVNNNQCIGITVPSNVLGATLDRAIAIANALNNPVGLIQSLTSDEPGVSLWFQTCETRTADAVTAPIALPGIQNVVAAQPIIAPDIASDRTILHGSDGSLWVMAGGAKFYFGSMSEFYSLGYSTSGMTEVTTSQLAAVPNMPRIGTILRSGGGQIYAVAGGAKFPFGSMSEYFGQGYANNAWINVPQAPLNAIGDAPGNMPSNGTIIKHPNGNVYVVVGGAKFQFGSMTEYSSLGYATNQINYVSAAPTDAIPSASTSTPPRNGTVLRGGGGQIYVVAGGAKFQFGSMTEYNTLGYANNAWYNVPQGPLDQVGDAPGNLPVNGTLLKGTGPNIYIMQGGLRKVFTSMTQFTSLGYQTSNIVNVGDAPLLALPDGGNVS